ncbi:MAG: fabF [Phycisphaerales bacterium]|nr:fabF [Phycisphaerales bacterium]
MSRRVVVTGIGIVSPIGIGTAAFWQNLTAGACGVRRIASYDPSGFPSQIGGEVPAYKINDFVPKSYRKATKVMARDIELAVIAADDAFKDSGLKSKAYADAPTIEGHRFGCNIGAGLISIDLAELTGALTAARSAADPGKLDLTKWGQEGMQQLTPLWLLKYLPNMLACHVTIIHGLKGPSNTITCADASSHLAIGEAYRTVQRGDADLAICGGAETKIVPMALMRQILLKRVTTEHNDTPERAVRPFDAAATGTAAAEGGGLLILEEYEHAAARGAKIYAEIVGFGASQDTYRVTEPDPSGHSYGRAVSKALAEANLPPAAVDLIVPCGIGIPGHDRAELAGLDTVFGNGLGRVAMSTIKAQVGNLAAGSGVDAATAALSVFHGVVPPAKNTTTPAGGRTLNVSPESRQLAVNVAVSSVYSLGGQNAALVFKKI